MRASLSPYNHRDDAVVGWILAYQHSAFIRKYVNLDVMRKILGYLKMVEIPQVFQLDGGRRLFNRCQPLIVRRVPILHYGIVLDQQGMFHTI